MEPKVFIQEEENLKLKMKMYVEIVIYSLPEF